MRSRVRHHPTWSRDSGVSPDTSLDRTGTATASALPIAQAATRSGGEPLAPRLRQEMEQRFAHDFGHVRVHADTRAAASTALLDAPAYATGSDLVFGAGLYAPETDAGRSLLAHELAHVVQRDSGETRGAPPLDEREADPLEQDATRRARAPSGHAHNHARGQCQCARCRAERGLPPLPGTEGRECPCSKAQEHQGATGDHGDTAPAGTPVTVHRARWEEYQAPRYSPEHHSGHTPGSDYQGPQGAVTQRGDDAASIGGSKALGGTVSYGCYCGPGGDAATGSRCGVGAPAVDAIDEQCRQHDKNYGFRNVDSGDVEGKANMWSRAGWLASADADEQLRASVEAEMDANPSAYSPSARLYGQGIKGIFGGRARGAEAYNWGSQRYGEAEAGVGGAYNDASSFLSDRSALGSELVGSNVAGAQSFAESTVGRAGAGISSFLSSASGWSSAGDVAGGLFGGARDALSFIGESQLEGLTRAAGGLGELAGFAGDTLVSGGTGAWGALGRGATFASQTLGEAAVGGGSALLDAAEWKGETEQAIGDVGLDLLGRGARSVGEAVTGLSPRDIAGPLLAPNPVQEWIKGWF